MLEGLGGVLAMEWCAVTYRIQCEVQAGLLGKFSLGNNAAVVMEERSN